MNLWVKLWINMGKKDSKDLKKQAKNIQIVVTSDNEVEYGNTGCGHFKRGIQN